MIVDDNTWAALTLSDTHNFAMCENVSHSPPQTERMSLNHVHTPVARLECNKCLDNLCGTKMFSQQNTSIVQCAWLMKVFATRNCCAHTSWQTKQLFWHIPRTKSETNAILCVYHLWLSCTSSKFPFHLRRRAEESHHLHWPVNIKWIQLNSSQMPLQCYTYTYMCHHDDAIQHSDCMTLLRFCVTSAASSWFQ